MIISGMVLITKLFHINQLKITSSISFINTTPACVCPKNTIDELKKCMKRDPSLFEVYKDEKQWDKRKFSTIALVRVHDVEDVLDGFVYADG
jgi:hypothetical protein